MDNKGVIMIPPMILGFVIVLVSLIISYYWFQSFFVTIIIVAAGAFFAYLAIKTKKNNQRLGLGLIAVILIFFGLFGSQLGLFSTFGQEFQNSDISIVYKLNTDPTNSSNFHQFVYAGHFINRSVLPNSNLKITVDNSYAQCGQVYTRVAADFTQYIDGVKIGETQCVSSCGSSASTVSGCGIIPGTIETANLAGGYHTLKVMGKSTFTDNAGQPIASYGESIMWQGQFYKEPNECVDPSYITYIVPVTSGVTLKKNPTQANEVGFAVSNPIFCHTIPIQKNKTGDVVEQSTQELDVLTNGSYVTVPAGELWLVSYRGLPNQAASGIIACSDGGGVWDGTNNKCEMPPTIYYNCNGVQTTTKDCITSEPAQCIDPEAVLDATNGLCYKFIDTIVDVNPVCPSGATLKEVNGNLACEWNEVSCPEGSNWSAEKKVCINVLVEEEPIDGTVSVGDFALDTNTTYIIIGVMAIVIVAGAVFIFSKKRRGRR